MDLQGADSSMMHRRGAVRRRTSHLVRNPDCIQIAISPRPQCSPGRALPPHLVAGFRAKINKGYCLRHNVVGAQSPFSATETRTMRAYVAVTGVAVGLIAVWAALAPFV
jgi:hypothetical protein